MNWDIAALLAIAAALIWRVFTEQRDARAEERARRNYGRNE